MSQRLRIAVCNLQSGIGTTRGYWHYLVSGWKYCFPHDSTPIVRAGDFLRQERVGLALLTEVEGGSARSRGIDQLALISARSGLAHQAFFPTLVLGRRVNQGNAICAQWPLRAIRNHPLPGRGEPRFISEAALTIGGIVCSLFVTHLALERLVRTPQIQHVAELVGREDRPTLLAGDFNISEDAELDLISHSVLERVAALPTFPSWAPKHALDHLFFSSHFRLLAASAFTGWRFSDHLPLVVDLELRDAPPPAGPIGELAPW